MQKVRGDLQAAEAQMAKNNHKANQPDAGLHLAAVDAHQRNQQQPKGSVEDQAKLAATTMKVNSVKIGATNTHHDPLPSGGGTRQNGIEAHMA